MKHSFSGRYFDLSTLFALGLAALLLVSLPGGCGDSEEADDVEDVSSTESAEPTAPPMMEIVDPEPGDLDDVEPLSPDDEEPAPEGEEGEEGEEGQGEGEDTPDGVYVVQEGDTLYGIAVQFNVTMEALMNENGMEDPNALQVGQELQIP
ncbi:MAG: LysM domain-containing protein [Sphaerobacteraceae bacterium]|nr:MAG: LysM domain-containing protein [Sphaerobacteraceae bacterium]